MRPQQLGQKRSLIMGRPLGSRDRFPRGTAKAEKLKLLETENGELRRQLAECELGRPWRGDVASALIAVAKGEHYMTMTQLYAGKIVYLDGIEKARAALDELRAELRRREADVDRLLDVHAKFAELIRAELPDRVAAGDIKAIFAEEILAWWDDPAPKPLALPAPRRVEPSAPTADPYPDAISAPSAPASAPGTPWASEPPVEPQITRVLIANRPFVYFQTGAGHRFESNSNCEIEPAPTDTDDVKDLLRAGCRERK